MKLDRELTEKMFAAKTADDVKAIVESGADLSICSRMALDEVLTRIFKKRCTGLKELAVRMLEGAVRGEDIPDEPVAPSLNPPVPKPGVPSISPEERAERIKNRLLEICWNAKDHFIRFTQIRRDGDMKMLGATEEDMKLACKDHEKLVCGADSNGKIYVMERNQQVMDDLSTKYGDKYF